MHNVMVFAAQAGELETIQLMNKARMIIINGSLYESDSGDDSHAISSKVMEEAAANNHLTVVQ